MTEVVINGPLCVPIPQAPAGYSRLAVVGEVIDLPPGLATMLIETHWALPLPPETKPAEETA